MKVLLNSDKQIEVSDVLRECIQSEVERALERFDDRLTRVEVYLSDLNGPKGGPLADKRCVIEARPSGWQPVAATDDAETVMEAVSGAVNKMKRQLESGFGREADKR